ncbi:hypothetical protein FHL15_009123 [Xylaria flabelliformis]|uniref:Receptor L-domain domain-containing protein n=1 Tax=Xylaria flabelliformis TaxID=2512241 RepID=A0A553HPZ9_9PEZI|nr:hypothetical protein FHL15_009123 [Xylaria flabelliformis]
MDDCTYTIATQDDIDSLQAEIQGKWPACFTVVNIRGATGTLNFTTLNQTGSIYVDNNPELEVLSLPEMLSLESLVISDSASLTTLIVSKISADSVESTLNSIPLISFNITDAPNLSVVNLTSLDSVHSLSIFGGHGAPVAELFNISSASSISTDARIDVSSLESAQDIQLLRSGSLGYSRLTSVGNLTLLNATTEPFTSLGLTARNEALPPIQVNESLTLHTAFGDGTFSQAGLGRIGTVGADLNITAYSNLNVTFGALTAVGATLSLINNTNCTFGFSRVSSIGDLTLLDNVNTVLPLFPQLQMAENIHIRGYIDTSTGPNIFPSLVHVKGNVVIEAWNEDFNCSALVSQKNRFLINSLACNGTDNGTSTSAPNPSASIPPASKSTGLSPGALAGIGVSSGLVGIGLAAAVVWLFVHYKRRIDKLNFELAQRPQQSTGGPTTEENIRPDVSGLYETSGAGIVREKPDDPLVEMSVPPTEKPDDPLVELPVPVAHLPTLETLDDRPLYNSPRTEG